MGIAIGFPGAVMAVVLAEWREMFEPLVDIGDQTVFGVVDPHARGNMHRGDQDHALLDFGFPNSTQYLFRDIQIFPVFRGLKCEIFRIESHSEIIHARGWGGTTGRILIVDDEPPLLKMISVYLERLGHLVVTADTTEEAWAAAEGTQPEFSVAVLDATMTGLSMQDLALRMLGASPSLRVIATSGYPVNMAAIQAAAPGRVMFLPKPFTPEMLASAVRRMLAAQEETL